METKIKVVNTAQRIQQQICDGKCRKPRILKRVISGGQRGVDIAGVRAAKLLGIKTGGHMPEGFITQDGPKIGYKWQYGMVDDTPPLEKNGEFKPDYKTRTWKNVQEADATIRIATDFDSYGEVCTLNAIQHYQKLHLDIYLIPLWTIDGETQYRIPQRELAYWIVSHGIETLNIAGNSYNSIYDKAYAYILNTLSIVAWEL